jgi:hypothetical protein
MMVPQNVPVLTSWCLFFFRDPQKRIDYGCILADLETNLDIGLDFVFEIIPIITTEKRTVKTGNAFEDTRVLSNPKSD